MKLLTPNRHVVCEIEGSYYLVDTGMPNSFNFIGINEIDVGLGKKYPSQAIHPQSPKKRNADKLTGMNISGFIGMDIINKTNLSISFENQTIEFGISSFDYLDTTSFFALPFSTLNKYGCLITDQIVVCGNRLSCVAIDSGAYVSYYKEEYLSCFVETKECYKDANLYGDEWEGNYWKGTMTFAQPNNTVVRPVQVGIKPSIGSWKQLTEFDGFVGAFDLSDKQIVFDMKNGMIYCKKN